MEFRRNWKILWGKQGFEKTAGFASGEEAYFRLHLELLSRLRDFFGPTSFSTGRNHILQSRVVK